MAPPQNFEEFKGDAGFHMEDINMADFEEEKDNEGEGVRPAAEDLEAEELAKSSQLLMEIYGNKIKLDVQWFFESPVAMVEKDRIGQIGEINNAGLEGGGYFDHYGNEYGDEYG